MTRTKRGYKFPNLSYHLGNLWKRFFRKAERARKEQELRKLLKDPHEL